MGDKRIGIVAAGEDARATIDRIVELEQAGVHAAWLAGGGPDSLSVFAAAAVLTERIMLGTCITPTWPRHPIVAVQQIQAIANLAPGRFRFGVGPSHKRPIESTYGFDFKAPLTNLREYVHIVKTLLHEGAVDFDGRHYHAHSRISRPITDVPVMASALRRGSFEYCGAEADGAISWVCPAEYLRDVALPAMRTGADREGRPAPPLIAHAPVCVDDDPDEVRRAGAAQIGFYPRLPFYAQMFADAGYPEAKESGIVSERIIDAVVVGGDEESVAGRLQRLFDWGADEILVTVVTAWDDPQRSWERTVKAVARVAQSLSSE